MSEPESTTDPRKPFIHCEFNGELSAEINLNMERVSPFMIWGVAAMLNQYAQDLWMAHQMEHAAQEQRSGIVPVTVMPMDHLPRRARN